MEALRDAVEIDIALQYNDAYSETVFSFANNINTVDGGSHLSGFRTSLTRTINAIGQSLGLFISPLNTSTGLGVVTISFALAMCFLELGRTDEARQTLDEAIAKAPQHPPFPHRAAALRRRSARYRPVPACDGSG